MIQIDESITAADLLPAIRHMWELSAGKIRTIEKRWRPEDGAPVFTVRGQYTARGWTEWTQGFQFGSALLQFDATGDEEFLDLGRSRTLERMAPHVTHFGVHDHGFNNVSTYGALLRLMNEGRIQENGWERAFYEMALKCSGAVQARRWTRIPDGGFIYSFNGPQSLFADTIRSLRSLTLAHGLGHVLMDEADRKVSLLERLVQHAQATARYNVYYGEGRDAYDVRGRVAHESIFNVNDGSYRCPSTQQGYSPFSTWTRGLAWIMLGFAEMLEIMHLVTDEELEPFGGRDAVDGVLLRPAVACAEFYAANTPTNGIPYWDTGAPGLANLGDYLDRPADPLNSYEPVDSSAAAIAAQGMFRVSRWLQRAGRHSEGLPHWHAAMSVARTLFSENYLSEDPNHEGLLLHSVYHRPNGWDYVPPGAKVPRGESSMWGDYHLREAALYVQRLAEGGPYYTFFGDMK